MKQFGWYIFYKYSDIISYKRIFSYIRDNFKFIPDIIHTDYEKSLYNAFLKENTSNKKILQTFCFFHYIKAIRENMKKLKLTKKNLNNKCYEIIKNIEILSFIPKNKIPEYIENILKDINKEECFKKLTQYLQKNWFNKNYDLFNYSALIDYKSNLDGENKLMKAFYVTNNVSESLHAKFNSYLPKNQLQHKILLILWQRYLLMILLKKRI